ncbi:S-adenosyl-L-methionine-dependent methyltransferase [Glomus cerebriforme]|uniref:S-adenosyl-L-methionine-dependent methyltransferase n=1 Tax=Glomus cerebriforme TaxID=658196 RepID=A0A397SD24_9GLOM|nr:S-adenosyl-L-methionine-dependent methyltransferase [Glomus cerebriforme]
MQLDSVSKTSEYCYDLTRIVKQNEAGTRLEKFICQNFRSVIISKKLCRECFKRGEIFVNGKTAESARILQEGDIVHSQVNKLALEKDRLEIPDKTLLEDEYLAVICKKAGIPIRSLQESLAFVLDGGSGIIKEGKEYTCINKTQRAVNGLVIVSKSREIKIKLMALLKSGAIRQRYRILCHGKFPSLDEPFFHNHAPPFALQHVKFTRSTSGKEKYLTTLDIVLNNKSAISSAGIREYFVRINHPIVGSNSCSKELKSCKDKSLMMALLEVTFNHPITSEEIKVTTDEPEKFEKLRQRELKFFEQKKNETIKELRLYGIEISDQLDSRILPTAYITGEKEFFKLRFFVNQDTMIPRISTEYLVREVIDIFLNKLDSGFWKDKGRDSDNVFSILDCGTGSGCILISILHYILSLKLQIKKTILPHVFGLGLDINSSALDIARKNAERHLKLFISNNDNYDFQKVDFSNLHNYESVHNKGFDILVCNPPYLDIVRSLPDDDLRKFEPSNALFTEEGGYKFYRLLHESLEYSYINNLDILKKDSLVILEVGSKMSEKVKTIFAGWECIKSIRDNQGFERCLIFIRNSGE